MLRKLKNKSLVFYNKAISSFGMAFFIFILFYSPLLSQNGLWVVRYALNSSSQCEKLIDAAKSLNVTDIYLQVFAKGQAWYPTKTAFNSVKLNNEQCFKDIVERAHKNSIKIHAWINVLNIWSGNRYPPKKNHLFTQKKNIF